MKSIPLVLLIHLFLSLAVQSNAQPLLPWNTSTQLNSYRPLQPMPGSKPEFIDLDNDGDPDVMRYTTSNGFPVQWIDDDDDMKVTDKEGDTDNDCLMADVNKDGKYGSHGDAVIDWVDTNNNGFFDTISYDLYGDKKTDISFSLKDLGISDAAEVIKINNMQHADFSKLDKRVSESTWQSALSFQELAEKQGINTQWYALLKSQKSIRQQYSFGYWLKFYLFMDMLEKAKNEKNPSLAAEITKTYFGRK